MIYPLDKLTPITPNVGDEVVYTSLVSGEGLWAINNLVRLYTSSVHEPAKYVVKEIRGEYVRAEHKGKMYNLFIPYCYTLK